jgi:hypothetical protein
VNPDWFERARRLSAKLGLGAIVLLAGCGAASGPPSAGARLPSTAADATVALPTAALSAFAPIFVSGTGSAVAPFTIPATAAALALVTYRGATTFALDVLAPDGTVAQGLVNALGRYAGTRLFNVNEHAAVFRIRTAGPWAITVESVTQARSWDGASTLTGTGDDVIEIDPATSGTVAATLTFGGPAVFGVDGYSPAGRTSLLSGNGPFHGQVSLPSGTFLLAITAAGQWVLSLQ